MAQDLQPSSAPNALRDRIIAFLGNSPHLPTSVVAGACGVTDAYVSQIYSDPECRERITALRVKHLERSSKLDENYDKLEESLQHKLAQQLPQIYKPDQTIRAIQVINAAKRRGAGTAQENGAAGAGQVVQLTLPTAFIHNFTVNVNNQVVSAGPQDLTTIPIQAIPALISSREPPKLEPPNVQPAHQSPVSSS